jgi:hypothetical protein
MMYTSAVPVFAGDRYAYLGTWTQQQVEAWLADVRADLDEAHEQAVRPLRLWITGIKPERAR